jgi:FtsP/CotA-like multicopper oxidase with cupredoxin domain
MTNQIGAPGTSISRRDFMRATGSAGILGLAGCSAPRADAGGGGTPTVDGGGGGNDLPAAAAPQVVDVTEQNNQVTLRSVTSRLPAHPGDSMGGPVELPRVWAWQADDRAPSVPGPVIRTQEGEDIEVTLDNTEADMPHTVHFHGVSKTWENDGVPTTTGITVMPGEEHTYEIPANVPGTHLYHCHYQTHRHIDMGMYGFFRVDPEGYEPADQELFMTVKDWDSRLNRQLNGEDVSYSPRDRTPDVFTINGRSAPRTLHPEDGSPVLVSRGDTVRVHFGNNGYMSHPIHTHNHRFRVVEKDGSPIPEVARYEQDVVNMAPAERKTLEFEADADPGIYLIHCHKVAHAMNGNSYPGGMVGGIVYEEAMDSDVFAQLMDYAGYEL